MIRVASPETQCQTLDPSRFIQVREQLKDVHIRKGRMSRMSDESITTNAILASKRCGHSNLPTSISGTELKAEVNFRTPNGGNQPKVPQLRGTIEYDH